MVDGAQTGIRRERQRSRRSPRHAADAPTVDFSQSFEALGAVAYSGAEVSAKAVDLATGDELLAIDAHVVMPIAGLGRVLLLAEVSTRLTARDVSGYGILDRTPRDSVGGPGLWRHLQAPSLPVGDLAAIVAATADGLATNVLLERVGLESVRHRAEGLGMHRTVFLDSARDHRGPDDAPDLAVGSTGELAELFRRIALEDVVDPASSQRLQHWLSLAGDLSLVSSAFGLDPLAHREADHETLLINATGSGDGIRAEAGALRGRARAVAYAVTARFDDTGLDARLRVIEAMRAVGTDLLEYVHTP